MPVSDLFDRARADRPHHIALIDAEGPLTYAELGAATDRAAGWLRSRGVREGERVVHAGPGDRTFLALLWAALRIGAVFVPVHPELTDHAVRHIVRDCAAALAICPPAAGSDAHETVEVARAAREIQQAPAGTVAVSAPNDVTAPDNVTVPDDAIALLIYTSGTTGRPKGVVCPHRQVLAAVHAVNDRLGYRADDVVLCRLPLSFDYGLYQALLCALTGSTLVLADRDGDLGLLRAVERHGVTVVPLVPSLARILALLRKRPGPPTKVRLFTNTGARPSRSVMGELLDAFPGSAFASMYGMTECKRISVLDPALYADHPDAVGRAIPGDHVRIVGPDGRTLPPGETGEIVVWGATVMAGYWGVPLEEQDRYVRRADGTLELHTGDQGRLDADGLLYFLGRDDDMVKRRGVRIALSEIEHAAERVPGVYAAVAPRPADDDAPLLLAVQSDLDPHEIRTALTVRLDPARLPDRIVPLSAVPLTANGKPDRPAVARLLQAAPAPAPAPGPETVTPAEPTRNSHGSVAV
ncbi:class I adenylate-forming enzyme family protein [Streptomyces sp. DvalAA-19]|uniref:class I adenylate-forming enzyme family protein n=1 Tax=Streptomyces sp. DvalAA-19 TaxID=1839761 RepID=UPI00081BB3F8|nr:class I adenylate-forming enzyme family protein [Streptomyces sp. DvalAA-19]SCE00039.1 amino acid adenylation domain-containing protein [Streptomyces sp. DvalAA-19]